MAFSAAALASNLQMAAVGPALPVPTNYAVVLMHQQTIFDDAIPLILASCIFTDPLLWPGKMVMWRQLGTGMNTAQPSKRSRWS